MVRGSTSVWWGLAAAAIYLPSAAPGLVWADSAKLTLYALEGYLPSFNPGDHAGWTLVARVWLALTWFLPPAYALNLLSAVSGAMVVGGVHRLVQLWGDDRRAGHGAAAVLLASHPLWWSAAVAESYAPALAMVVVGALALEGRRTVRGVVGGVCFGLAVAAHAFALLLVIPAVFSACRRGCLGVAGGALAGTAPLWLAVAGAPPDPLTGYTAGAIASWSWHLDAFVSLARVARGAVLVAGGTVLALGPVGLWGMVRRVRDGGVSRHPSPRLAALAVLALAILFSAYSPFRLHLMAVFLVVGVVLVVPPLLSVRGCLLHLALQAALYGSAVAGAHLLDRETLGLRQLPGRDNARYFLWPPKTGEDSAQTYAEELLQAAPAGAVVLADFNPGAVLRLAQDLQGLRRDVEVIPTAVDDALATPDPPAALAQRVEAFHAAGRPVVLADRWELYYRLDELRTLGWQWEPCGPGLVIRHRGVPP